MGSLATWGVSCDTAQGRALARCDMALGRLRHGHKLCDTATRPATRSGATPMRARACAHLGVLAGSAGSAHCALVQFLDSVLFLSHCLDTVHHKKNSKKILIK